MSERRIGVLGSGRSRYVHALVEYINRAAPEGVRAGLCRVYETRENARCPYDLIIDRISHWNTYFRPYLKHAVLTGAYVINNPFWFLADDKFFNYSVMPKYGVAVPRTVLLPPREYRADRAVREEDLQNVGYPLHWDAVIDYVGLPAILKPYDGHGWETVTRVDTPQQLADAYRASATRVMVLQEFIKFEQYVRCFVYGKTRVLPVRYDPHERRYIIDHHYLSDEMGARVVRDARIICQVLGYDMNTVEFAIRDDVPYAIDYMNPIPDSEPQSITEHYFNLVVQSLGDTALEIVAQPSRPALQQIPERFHAAVAAFCPPDADPAPAGEDTLAALAPTSPAKRPADPVSADGGPDAPRPGR